MQAITFRSWRRKIHADSFARPIDKKRGELLYDKEDDIKDYTDRHYSFTNEKKQYSIELIFGKNKIFLIIHSNTDKQQEISEIIYKFIED